MFQIAKLHVLADPEGIRSMILNHPLVPIERLLPDPGVQLEACQWMIIAAHTGQDRQSNGVRIASKLHLAIEILYTRSDGATYPRHLPCLATFIMVSAFYARS